MILRSPKLRLSIVHEPTPSSRPVMVTDHSAPFAPGPEVEVEFSLHENPARLITRFWVRQSTPVVDSNHSTDQSIWGLWEKDVVEVFVGVAPPLTTGASPLAPLPQAYWEFQVSPLGQWFELKILEARKNLDRNAASGFKKSATRTGADSWEATLEIPLGIFKDLLAPASQSGDTTDLSSPWLSRSLIGGAFAILGPPSQRTYLALHLPKQEKPDFHLPGFFKPFFADRE
jgi:hypothetical protein